MIFFLRILVFSFLISLGFHLSLRSKKLRAAVSVAYGCVLVWYTFLCRVHLYVNVSAADYGHTATRVTTGEKILQLLKSIFGMQANGNLAGNYEQAFVLNILLFVPMGFLALLWMLDGDRNSSHVNTRSDFPNPSVKDVAFTGSSPVKEENRTITEQRTETRITRKNLIHKAVWSILICIITSVLIELLQGLTGLGMTDVNDVLANSIGGVGGVVLTLVWLRKHFCVSE